MLVRVDSGKENPVRIQRRGWLVLFSITIIGSLAVFTGVTSLNRLVNEKNDTKNVGVVNFTIPQKPSKPPPPPEPVKQKQVRRNREPALAPVPMLGSGFSGIALSFSDFGTMGGGSVSEGLLGDLENVVMTEDSVDSPPIAKNVAVVYPERAKQRQIEGEVLVSLRIDENGNVLQAEILESNPPGVFDAAVIEAAKGWTFVPAKYQGRGVATWVNLPIPFSLH